MSLHLQIVQQRRESPKPFGVDAARTVANQLGDRVDRDAFCAELPQPIAERFEIVDARPQPAVAELHAEVIRWPPK